MAENTESAGTPWHLWAVGVASLMWNSLGAVDYTMTKAHNQTWLAGFTPEQLAWIESFPFWANLAWALGVWGAFAGSILLLLRKGLAFQAFAVSLSGLAVSTLYQRGVAEVPEGLDTSGGKAFNALLWAVAIALLIYARKMRARKQLD